MRAKAVLAVLAVTTLLGGSAVAEQVERRLKTHDVIPIPELAPRYSPAVAWTGGALFVFGGQKLNKRGQNPWRFSRDGALVHLDPVKTVRLPDAPFAHPLNSPFAVRAGGSVLVIGEACDTPRHFDPEGDSPPCEPGTRVAARYVIAKHRWRRVQLPRSLVELDPRSRGIYSLGTTSDGRAVIVSRGQIAQRFWTYDARADRWSEIPDSGLRADGSCLSGDDLYVLHTKYEKRGVVVDFDETAWRVTGGTLYAGDGFVSPSFAILRLRGNGAWQRTPAATGVKFMSTGIGPQLSCLHAGALLWDPGSPQGQKAVYDQSTGVWRVPPKPPNGTYARDAVLTDHELVFLPSEADVGAPAQAYDLATNSWRLLSGVPPVTRGAVWSGEAIVGYAEPLPTASPLEPGTQPKFHQSKAGVFVFVPGT